MTDAQGQYHVEAPHHCSVIAFAPGMAALDYLQVDEPDGDLDGLDLELHPSRKVRGYVTADSQLVEGASVNAQYTRPLSRLLIRRERRSL